MKRFHLALGVADVESSADDSTQRLGAGRACSSLESMRCDARMRSTCRFGKWATKRVGLAGGMGRTMWSGVAMLLAVVTWRESSADRACWSYARPNRFASEH